jgi:hypothetical protein
MHWHFRRDLRRILFGLLFQNQIVTMLIHNGGLRKDLAVDWLEPARDGISIGRDGFRGLFSLVTYLVRVRGSFEAWPSFDEDLRELYVAWWEALDPKMLRIVEELVRDGVATTEATSSDNQ